MTAIDFELGDDFDDFVDQLSEGEPEMRDMFVERLGMELADSSFGSIEWRARIREFGRGFQYDTDHLGARFLDPGRTVDSLGRPIGSMRAPNGFTGPATENTIAYWEGLD